MSIRAIDWAFNQNCKNSSTKLVLLKLADNANDDGQCWPSMAYIADHCELSRRQVLRHLRRLESLKLIEIQHRFADRRQVPNLYLLAVPVCHPGVSRTSPPRVTRGRGRVSPVSHHKPSGTVIEPKRVSEELQKIIKGLASGKKVE